MKARRAHFHESYFFKWQSVPLKIQKTSEYIQIIQNLQINTVHVQRDHFYSVEYLYYDGIGERAFSHIACSSCSKWTKIFARDNTVSLSSPMMATYFIIYIRNGFSPYWQARARARAQFSSADYLFGRFPRGSRFRRNRIPPTVMHPRADKNRERGSRALAADEIEQKRTE